MKTALLLSTFFRQAPQASLWFALFLFSYSFAGRAAESTPSKGIEVGEEWYELSMGGLEDFMDDLAEGDKEAHTKMKPHFSHLKKKQKRARWWAYGLGVGGIALTLTGLALDNNVALMVSGVVMLPVGFLLGQFLSPSERDLKVFGDRYNGLGRGPSMQIHSSQLQLQRFRPKFALGWSFYF